LLAVLPAVPPSRRPAGFQADYREYFQRPPARLWQAPAVPHRAAAPVKRRFLFLLSKQCPPAYRIARSGSAGLLPL